MQCSWMRLACSLTATRGFFSIAANQERMIVSVLYYRIPIIVPNIDPVVYAYNEFAFRWKQQYARIIPEKILEKAESRFKTEFKVEDYVPAPRITEADKTNDRRTLNRALDRKLFLLIYGPTFDAPDKSTWHFPEKRYEGEESVRECADSALNAVIGDPSRAYFIGNAPVGHLEFWTEPKALYFTRFFMEAEVVGESEVKIKDCKDHVWVTKPEIVSEYFPEHYEYLRRMILCHPF